MKTLQLISRSSKCFVVSQVIFCFLAAFGAATAWSQTSSFIKLETIAVMQVGVGEGERGEAFLRRIGFGVIMPTLSENEVVTTRACINTAFEGEKKQDLLSAKLQSNVDKAFKMWKDYVPQPPENENLLDNAEQARTYGERILREKATAFKDAVNAVTIALNHIDLEFHQRLGSTAACNDILPTLVKKAYLALVQRVCPPDIENCGADLSPQGPRKLLEGEPFADRFEMLIAWAVTTQGVQNNSLVKVNIPVLIGPASSSKEVQSVVGTFQKGGSGNDAFIDEGKPDDLELALERLVQRQQQSGGSQKISSATFLVLNTPKQIAIRMAQLGIVARPDFGLTHTPDVFTATYKLLSDDVARRRLTDCIALGGIPSSNLDRLKACSGYRWQNANQVVACLNAKETCQPVIDFHHEVIKRSYQKDQIIDTPIISQGVSQMVGTDVSLNHLFQANLLPRLQAADVSFKSMATNALQNCKTSGAVAAAKEEMTSELAECLLRKTLGKVGNIDRNRLAGCLIEAKEQKDNKNPLSVAEVERATKCYANGNPALEGRLDKVSENLKCINPPDGASLQSCLVKIQIQGDPKLLWDCYGSGSNTEDKVRCYALAKGTNPAKIYECVTDTSKQMECLQQFLPKGATQLVDIQKQCSAADNAMGYFGCAKALGINIDQNLIECSSKGTWDGAAACAADKKIGGPLGQMASCYSESATTGGSGFAGCVAGRMMSFNEDLQMLTQCASATGAEPVSTGTCTFGKLAMRELTFCAGKRFGDDKCFGENNTLRKILHIEPNSPVAQIINWQLDIINGTFSFAQNPGATAEASLRNAGRELTIFKKNVYEQIARDAENFRREVTNLLQNGGVYVKIDSNHFEVGPVHLGW